MPTLRQIIDGKTLDAAAPPPVAGAPTPAASKGPFPPKKGKGSALTQHVSNHMQDPVGATKDQFGKLQEAKLQYDLAREAAQRNIAPVQSVIQHLSQMHGLQPNMPTPGMDQPGMGMNPDQQMGYNEQDQDIPPNMGQTPGQMNMNRPSMAGTKPGVAPAGFSEKQVVPTKMGVPTPGRQGAPVAGNPSTPPKKAASGAGGKKPASKKSNGGGGGVNVTVHAGIPLIKASRSINTQLSYGALKTGITAAGSMKGAKKGWSTRGKGHLAAKEKKAHYENMDSTGMSRVGPGAPIGRQRLLSSKPFPGARKVKAGPSTLSDKNTGSGNELALNPVIRSGKMGRCKACGMMKANCKCGAK